MDDTQFFHNSMGCKIDYVDVIKACEGEPYTMSLVGDDAKVVTQAINIGIDSRLQAVFGNFANGERSITATGDTDYWKDGDKLILANTLECEVEPASLPVLLRRLYEDGEDDGHSLTESILTTLGFDEEGRFVGREALGLD